LTSEFTVLCATATVQSRIRDKKPIYKQRQHAHLAISNNGNVGIVALETARESGQVRLPHAPPHGKPAPLLSDEARSASDAVHISQISNSSFDGCDFI
jgi:hypothetical protein